MIMENKELMSEWKKNSIRIGTPTNLLAAFTSFLPVLQSAVFLRENLRYEGSRRTGIFLQPVLRSHSSGTPFFHYCALPVKHHNEDILLHIRRTCKKGIRHTPFDSETK